MSARKDNGYDFPEDEFDRIAAENEGPAGTHREVRSRWSRFLPFLIVLVVAPTLAYLAVAYMAGDFGGEPKVTASDIVNQLNPDETGTDDESDGTTDGETDGGLTGEDLPAEPAPAAPAINYSAPIAVLNGANQQGIAAKASDKLNAANFAQTEATNFDAAKKTPTASTVYYASEDLAPTAQEVARVLGITAVEMDASHGPSVTVVIRKDFKA